MCKCSIADVINNREDMGKIAKWALEFMPYDITYVPHISSKGRERFIFQIGCDLYMVK